MKKRDNSPEACARRLARIAEMNSETENTKDDIVADLETAAGRSSSPATPKQIAYLASLLFAKNLTAAAVGCGSLSTTVTLSKKAASEAIEFIKNN